MMKRIVAVLLGVFLPSVIAIYAPTIVAHAQGLRLILSLVSV